MMTLQKKILVVDDEVGFNHLLQELFETTEHKILSANDAEEALQILRNEKVDFYFDEPDPLCVTCIDNL